MLTNGYNIRAPTNGVDTRKSLAYRDSNIPIDVDTTADTYQLSIILFGKHLHIGEINGLDRS